MAVEKIYNATQDTRAEAIRVLQDRTSTAEERSVAVEQLGVEKAQEIMAIDRNDYDLELDEETKADAKERGRRTAEQATGHDGTAESWGKIGTSGVGAAGAGAVAVATNLSSTGIANGISVELSKKATKKMAEKAASKAAKKGTEKAVEQGTKKVGEKTASTGAKEAGGKVAVGDIITVGITTATLGHYAATKPNQDEHEAAVVLRDQELPSAMMDLDETQGNIEDTANAIQEQTEEAEALKEGAAETIEENKVDLEIHKARAEELKAKKATNVALTQDERAELKSLNSVMQGTSTQIGKTSEEANEEIQDIHSDMTDKQENFDDAAETMSEVEGLTDYASGFDKTSQVQSYVEAGAMGVNGASATAAGYSILAKSAFSFGTTTALGLLGIATGVGSALATKQQIGYASDIGNEIDRREETENINVETNEFYEDELDIFAGELDYVENDLVVDIPKDVEINDVNAPIESEEPSSSITDIAMQNDQKKKDKKNGVNNETQPAQYQLSFGETTQKKAKNVDNKNENNQNPVKNDKKAEEEEKK